MSLLSLYQVGFVALTSVPTRGGGGEGGGSSGGSSGDGSSYSGGGSGGSYTGGSSGSSSGSGGGGFSPVNIIIVLILIALVGFVIVQKVRGKGGKTRIRFSVGSGSNSNYNSNIDQNSGFQMNLGSNSNSRFNSVNDLAASGSMPQSEQQLAAIRSGYSQLVARDPGFDSGQFEDSVQRIFYAVEQAWCERDPSKTRTVMNDSLWQNHKQQMDAYVTRGAFNRLDSLALQFTFIESIQLGQTNQQIVVRFFADSADYDVNDAGKVLTGHKNVTSWTEDWVFVRSATATSKVGGGISAARCPNCNAPLDVDALGNCNFCKAAIMGGQHDWVLDRIDQIASLEIGWAMRGISCRELTS